MLIGESLRKLWPAFLIGHRDMDFEDRPLQRQGHHQAHVDDITLRTTDDFQFGQNDPFDIGPSDGIGSQDFNDVDLGIHWGDELDKSDALSVRDSIGVGRDVQHEGSIEPDLFGGNGFNPDLELLSHKSRSRDPSEQPFGSAMDIDIFPEVDLGDLGIGFDDPPLDTNGRTPSATRSLSRACKSRHISRFDKILTTFLSVSIAFD